MIPISKGIDIVKRKTGSLGSQTVPLGDSVGRVLAEDIRADTDMPPFDRSQMDGFAVQAQDTKNAPAVLMIVGESAAGRGWHHKLKSGEAVRIMTGAPVPSGADSIQKVELTRERRGAVTITEPTEKGRYIVKKGAEIKKGERLFLKSELVNEQMIASLAAFGYSSVKVAKQPTVSIMATGSEIVPINSKPARDQIRNSNSVMLKALCEQAGANVKLLPSKSDDLEKLKAQIAKAVGHESHILVLTGGVSVGKYDLTKTALKDLGAEIFFEKVRLRPGKPTVFAQLNKTLIFGLPGNPVSAAVTFYLFVRPAILKMQNASQTDLAQGSAVLTSTARAARERDTLLPATLATDERGRLLATPLRWHGSSDFVGFAKAEALVSLGAGDTFEAGEVVKILFF
jgi:molybdopterin molybdotransferase